MRPNHRRRSTRHVVSGEDGVRPSSFLQPWTAIRKTICAQLDVYESNQYASTSISQDLLGVSRDSFAGPLSDGSGNNHYEVSNDDRNHSQSHHASQADGDHVDNTDSMQQVPLAVPHGFRMLRTLHNPKSALMAALYMNYYNTDMFLTLDSQSVGVWKGNRKLKSMATHIGEKKGGVKESAVAGVCHWVYVKEWRCVIVGNMQMQLRILDSSHSEISSVLSMGPVLRYALVSRLMP
jgi:hypothetical protein